MPSTSNGSLILPLVLWNNSAPDCHISSLLVNETEKFIFTGTTSGHIIMWEFDVDDVTPLCLMIGHTSVVNCLAKAGSSKEEEFIVSSSENGEMKLWEINDRKCVESIKMSNTVHKSIYSSKVSGKHTRLFCVGNYTDVLVMDPISLDILYTLVSREQPQWIKALCINTLASKQDDVIVGVSVTGTIKLWTVNTNDQRGSEIVEHEFKNCSCENANTLTSCPGKQRIFLVVCPKFFQLFDAFDFTVLCQVNISSVVGTTCPAASEAVFFTSGFFLDIDNLLVCASDGLAYLFSLPDNLIKSYLKLSSLKIAGSSSSSLSSSAASGTNPVTSVNPQSSVFRHRTDPTNPEKYSTANLVCKFTTSSLGNIDNKLSYYGPPIFYMYEMRRKTPVSTSTPLSQQQQQQKDHGAVPSAPHRKYLIRGDSNARISIWDLSSLPSSTPNTTVTTIAHASGSRQSSYEISLSRFWAENVKEDNENIDSISTLLYLPTIDKIVYGLLDGSIVILPAIEFLVKHLFKREGQKWHQHQQQLTANNFASSSNGIKLKKHNDKVTCILYPHSESPRYDPTMLVTGSADFSVVLWNINTGEMVHRFVVQTGEILQLSVPPNNVNPRILQCVCSIASDHSVSLLSLKECKPVMIASRHLFPIMFIKWRPLDDYLLVKCSDGGVFVWQIETGNLDRVAHGLLAEDILSAADELLLNNNQYSGSEGSSSSTIFISAPSSTASTSGGAAGSSSSSSSNTSATTSTSAATSSTANAAAAALAAGVGSSLSPPTVVSNKLISNQTITLAHILQKRNYNNAARALGQKSIRDDHRRNLPASESSSINFPIVIQPFHLNTRDPVNHLLLFDIDSLLTTLILEEQGIDSMVKYIKNSFFKDTHTIHTAATLYRNVNTDYGVPQQPFGLKRVASSKLCDSIDIKQLNSLKTKVTFAQSIIRLTHILLSSLHMWSVDESLDKLFAEKIFLQKPKYPIGFGRISRGSHLFVMFPHRKSNFAVADTNASSRAAAAKSSSVSMPNSESINLISFGLSDDDLKQKGAAPTPASASTLTSSSAAKTVVSARSGSLSLTMRANDTAAAAVALLDTPSPTRETWLCCKTISTEHLLAILAISNSFMNLQNFIDLQIKKEDTDPIEFILGESTSHSLPSEHNNFGEEQSTIKQTYSRLSTMYCMLADYYSGSLHGIGASSGNSSAVSGSGGGPAAWAAKGLNLETLALKWMDQSYEIREAAQTLLKNELKRIGPSGRAALIKVWEPQLSSLLKDFDDLSQLSVVQQQQQQHQQPLSVGTLQSSTTLTMSTSQQLHGGVTTSASGSQTQAGSGAGADLQSTGLASAASGYHLSGSHSDLAGSSSGVKPNSSRIRRKQYVAIILLSLIGAEFGQDVNSNKNQAPYKTIPQGFSLEDHSILKRISTALSNLVTNKALNHDITRRAAIDLVARGFTIWEPFIQPTFVLLSLLELAADAELYVPRNDLWKNTMKDHRLTINLPLSPIADTCRIARNSLSLIANSKPKTFILTVSKEIKRANAPSSQSAQVANTSYPFAGALTRGKPEILKIIEKLIENQSQDVFELLSDVIEIALFCLDPNQIRSNGLEDNFPAIFKFSMVRYCRESKRIVCGCHNGRLVMYEYKASKWNIQSYPAHNGQPIVAVAVSSDSKYVASYSAHDNSLIFWQSSGGHILNFGSSSIKPIKTCTAAPIEINVPCIKLANLAWQNRTLNLSYHDQRRFSYQI